MSPSDPVVPRPGPMRALVATGLICLLGAGLVAGCGGSGGDGEDEPTGEAAGGGATTEVFFTEGEQFRPTEVPLETTDDARAPLEATEALLDGPAEAGGDTETLIPEGVEVEKLEIDDSGRATVDLSDEFLGDIPADPAKRSPAEEEKVTARVGQVTYTLTAFENVDSARVRSGGIAVGGTTDRTDYKPTANKPKPPKVRGGGGGLAPGTLQMQRRLADLGYLPPGGVDGIAGYQTEQAVMAFQAWEGLGRDGVAGPVTKAALKTAKRPRPKTKRPQRLMEVHLEKGVLLLVKNGRTKRVIHVSAGAPATATPTGRYRVFRKELQSWSYPFSTWLPYASYFNNGIAFHEYPEVPAYPASHGCVRVPTPEAKRVYAFATMDTVVVVRG